MNLPHVSFVENGNTINNCIFDEKLTIFWGWVYYIMCQSQWPRRLSLRSAAARLLRLWIRIPPGAWMFVCCECFVSSGRGLCDDLISRPEESYRPWLVVVCGLETSWMRRPWPTCGAVASKTNKQTNKLYYVVQLLKLFLSSTKGAGCVNFNSAIGLSLIYRANTSTGQLFFMPQLLNKSLPALRLTAARLHY